MPFRSEMQREKWKELVSEGRVTQEQFDARDAETDVENLPLRAPARQRTVGPSRAPQMQKLKNRRY